MAAGRPMTLILSDIEQSGVEDGVLYGEVARLVAAAGVSRLIGVGDRIRNAGANFACDSAFYRTTDELLRNLRRDDVAGRVVLIKGSRDSHFERVSHALERKSHTTVLEVDLDAMIHNLNYFRARLRPGVRLVAMVKAASYGAGDFEVAQMLQHQGVNYLAVAFADEGVLLRERGIRMPIVVLNADEGSFDLMVAHRLEPEIYNFRSLAFFSKAVERVGEESYPIHIKLDTGMHRLGFMEGELDMLTETLGETPSVKVATIFSHLNCSDMPQEDRYTREQIARFDRMSGRLAAALPYPVLRHTANSAAIERFPEAQFDMCRLGLGLYGFGFEHNDELKPVSTLKSRIVQLKHLSAGEAVGYGRADGVCRRTGPSSGVRPVVDAGRGAARADRGPRLHGQLYDRRDRHSRRGGGGRGGDLLRGAGQYARRYGPRTRYDPLRGDDLRVGPCETDLQQRVKKRIPTEPDAGAVAEAGCSINGMKICRRNEIRDSRVRFT